MMVWLQFIACTAVITWAGTKLSKYGDVIAEKTGMGRTWIGVVLMASVTSLPEVITGVSSVAVFNLPDIAAGDVLGSCMFNLVIIALLDFRSGEKPILSDAKQDQLLAAAFGLLLLGVASISIRASETIPAFGWVSLSTIVLLTLYLLAMRMTFNSSRKLAEQAEKELHYEGVSTKRAVTMYALNALLVIAAATWLPRIGERIAEMTGLGHTFVGSLFIALSTSLPELVVSFAALSLGAPSLALGNLFGSNLFNMAVFGVDDLLFTKGPLISHISASHLVSANGAMVLVAVILIGILYPTKKKWFGLSWASLALMIVFVTVAWLVYLLK